ncbi:hypothetical protein P775_25810 [Puniceibacterium antarcticum]|uniref:Oxidoreductase molybdopterin-binding domain-containing protein n=1 Tax=Puniceibacterium antarcticum TaxID=1206336 RepID=A0A2G8R220_9RHOB|nr:molybdopterin-dependent oxidoreductase [Puniceibacterium antarcticum]PIL15597.1 hypothetical protein P775_25810 [Puniceibacterium antarcticum]
MNRALFYAVVMTVFTAIAATAQALPAPAGPVILTVSGDIDVTNVDDTAQFDLAMLNAMDSTTFSTSTIWTKGTRSFKGVPLNVLVESLGIEGETLRATAVNDYAIDIPISDAVQNGPILAYEMDGRTMTLRDKGPLWLVYPYDLNANYRTEVIYSRSIWQLDRITALK